MEYQIVKVPYASFKVGRKNKNDSKGKITGTNKDNY